MATKRIDLDPVAEASLYPKALADAEEQRGVKKRIGVALSGGGIRSATLSLGFFQGLAQQSLVQCVDYMSTVSGGGYFGGFFGHLLHRPPAGYTGPNDRTKADAVLKDQSAAPFRFLRENGRYLSPNGAGDLLSAGAGALRNWMSVLIVQALLALFALTLVALARYGIEDAFAKWSAIPAIAWYPWASPLVLLLLALIPVLVVPPGWAYWLVSEGDGSDTISLALAKWGKLLVAAALMWYWWTNWADRAGWSWEWAALVFSALSILTVVRFVYALVVAGRTEQAMRDHLTRGLARGLMVLMMLGVIVLIDSFGQALVMLVNKALLVGYGGVVALVGVFRNRLLGLATRLRANESAGLPKAVVMGLAAAALLLVLLGGIASIPHFVAQWNSTFGYVTPVFAPDGAFRSLWILALIAGLMSVAVSRVWSFVNRSSLHAVYEARIRRAYFGASNPARTGEGESRPPVTEPHKDDGLTWDAYDPSAHGGPVHIVNVTINETVDGTSQVQQRDRKGVGMAIGPDGVSVGRTHHALWKAADAPVGLLNNVMNAFRRVSQLQIPRSARDDTLTSRDDTLTSRDDTQTSAATTRFRVFPDDVAAKPEPLDVGQWVAISGGAVSTGLGARTNIALSILIGFFNVRLGYWWGSGVNPDSRSGRTRRAWTRRLAATMRKVWPVQSALLDEWLARFPGVARREWNLTDGGHFENMGAYELLRRRLPLIIVCDNEEDSDYTFSGLANLVRKARTDLNAEITFLDDHQLRNTSLFSVAMPAEVGTLDSLRRGRTTIEKVGNKEQVVVHAQQGRLSWSHAAAARIEYKDADATGKPASTFGCLLYVKPTLTGDEPVDVLQYHTEHPAFPQEPTSDQFFDEAQWESYRRLGEHIALKLFDPRVGLAGWMKKVAEGSAP